LQEIDHPILNVCIMNPEGGSDYWVVHYWVKAVAPAGHKGSDWPDLHQFHEGIGDYER
jgi:hypothetical protein